MADEAEREAKLKQLQHLKELGEKAYDDMYEAHSFRDSNDFYREAKECYYDAIGLARELGLTDEAESLSNRLLHIKEVFRSQFAQ
jgi:benzoyl-CoA reductase/2-hydroxyglutaryl-CoA dehydratase subunit BcrC/BadD/HgdB